MPARGDLSRPRSYLFVPANRTDRFDKALAAGAGAVVIDLEDAIAVEHKTNARVAFVQWCRVQPFDPDRLLVRINDESTPWFAEDLAAVASSGVRGNMLPKTESAGQVERAAGALPRDVRIIPLIESVHPPAASTGRRGSLPARRCGCGLGRTCDGCGREHGRRTG